MEENKWQSLRESGFRLFFIGLFSLAIAFMIYSRLTVPSSEGLRIDVNQLNGLAYGMLAITAASMASILHGAYTIFRSEQIRTSLSTADNLLSLITGAFSDRKYWKIMVVAAIAYGIFFGFLSQILIYLPEISLTEREINIPSFDLTPCCGAPGYMPMLAFYLTDHFLILIIPLNVILATVVSLLVGFNVAFSTFAIRFKKSLQTKTSLAAGLGATSGLFVGCPTCAGSIISALFGIGIAGAGGASASALAQFQTIFISASIPALVIAPFLTARSIRSASRCKVS